MDQPSKHENDVIEGCESEARNTCEMSEGSEKKYNPSGESSSRYSTDMEPSAGLTDDSYVVENIKQEYLSESSDSSSEMSEGEEFAELLQRCYAKSGNDCKTQSTDEDVEVEEGAAENSCPMADVESESDVSDAESSVTELNDRPRETVQGMIIESQPSDEMAPRNICPLCKKNFKRFHDLKKHIECQHLKQKKYRCNECGKSFSDKPALTLHITVSHGDRTYGCDHCDYSSKFIHTLARHMAAVHSEEKPHACSQCDSCFTEKRSLVRHIRDVHNEEKPYECKSCSKKFLTPQQRDLHLKTVHCGEKPYSCALCDYKCSHKSNLARHQRTVHEGLKNYSCSACEYKSSTMSLLQQHRIAVHFKQKPYACTECDKAFALQSNLSQHIDAIHKGLKPYSCTKCDSKFSQKSDLLKHIKAVHLKEKPFSCSVCCKSFSLRADAKKHEDAVHNGFKPYQCAQCSKTFSRSSDLSRHMRNVHR